MFENACFALELSMQKQEHLLKEDPFLGDANWYLVWRYDTAVLPRCLANDCSVLVLAGW